MSASAAEGVEMNKDLARSMIRTAFRASSEMQSMLPPSKAQLSPEKYRERAMAVASAVDMINQALIDPALQEFPELSDEVEQSLRQHGRYV
jgi:hypothetical protein